MLLEAATVRAPRVEGHTEEGNNAGRGRKSKKMGGMTHVGGMHIDFVSHQPYRPEVPGGMGPTTTQRFGLSVGEENWALSAWNEFHK